MAEAALILSPRPPTGPDRTAKPPKDLNDPGGQQQESRFADLLGAIEDLAEAGGQQVALPLDPALPAPPVQAPGPLLPGVREGNEPPDLLSAVVIKRAALQALAEGAPTPSSATGTDAGRSLSPFQSIRPLTTDSAAPKLRDGAASEPRATLARDLPAFLTGAERPQGLNDAAARYVSPADGLDPQALVGERLNARAQAALERFEAQSPGAPRADAAALQTTVHDTQNPVVRQVASGLQFAARGENQRLRLDLYPEDLGRVHIQLQKTGAVTRVLVVTETAQAFEALKAGAQGLQQSLGQAGFDTDDITFQSREDWDDGQGGRRETGADERQDRPSHPEQHDDTHHSGVEVLVRQADFNSHHVFL